MKKKKDIRRKYTIKEVKGKVKKKRKIKMKKKR